MNVRNSSFGPAFVFSLALVTGGWFLRQGVAQERSAGAQATLLQQVVDHISERYVEPVERGDLYDQAIQGVIESLGDPNTALLAGEAAENFRIRTEGDYGGVGLEILERNDYITVVGPIWGGPGDRAGLRAGDLIVEVEGQSTQGWLVQQAVDILRGTPGTEVDLRIRRSGVDDPIEFTLVRELIEIHSVPFAVLLEGGVGYVPLTLFSENSLEEVRAAADSLRREGATSLVLDLRGNPGGILDQGVGIADLFLPRGADVVQTRGRADEPAGILRASDPDRYEGVPVVVLVDRGSASASEIVAGALQDHDRALLIGGTTFGKGSVQSLFSLTGGNVLKLTTARWYTPQGRTIERMGADAELDSLGMPVAQSGHVPITILGQYAAPADTAGRPTVQSVGGRVLYGGGGIVPDLLVPTDTLTTPEQVAVRELFREAGRYTVGVFDYAVQFLGRDGNRSPDFQVTEADMEDLYRFLREEREVAVDLATLRTAQRFVRSQLESEIAAQGWGGIGAFQRESQYDAPLRRAIELLRTARSPEDLFARAAPSAVPGAQALRPSGF